MNNPDQDHVEKYINNMNLMKNRLLERRRTLQKKVEQEEKARENPLSTSYQGNLSKAIDIWSSATYNGPLKKGLKSPFDNSFA